MDAVSTRSVTRYGMRENDAVNAAQ